MSTQPNEPAALILRADTPFRDAVVLGQGLPQEKEGHKCFYRWKEALPTRTFRDKNGAEHTVTAQRVDDLIRNFNRAKEKGWLPPILDQHEKRGSKSYGYVVEARKGANGSLELLHQLVGEDALLASARNGTSICTVRNVTDESGDTYAELIDHQAIVPDPQLTGLQDFTPAIAASRGPAVRATVFELAADASTPRTTMNLTELRKAIGAKDDVPDEQVIQQATAKLGEAVPALELSRTQTATIATLTSERDTFKSERDAATTRALELSRGAVTPDVLPRELSFAKKQIDFALAQGRCTKPAADFLTEVVEQNGQPTPEAALMLSRTGVHGSPIDIALKLLELNKTLNGFQQTDGQPVPRMTPGANGEKAITPERMAELMNSTPLGQSVLAEAAKLVART